MSMILFSVDMLTLNQNDILSTPGIVVSLLSDKSTIRTPECCTKVTGPIPPALKYNPCQTEKDCHRH